MNDNKMVQQLLKGSRNINQMKKDVVLLVGMLPGLAKRIGLPSIESAYYFTIGSNTDCYWTMTYNKDKNNFDLTCRMKVHDGDKQTYEDGEIAYASGYAIDQISSNLAQYVFEGLPCLVGGMISRYPDLKKRFEPFLKASKVKF
jgi:hypothetical protein